MHTNPIASSSSAHYPTLGAKTAGKRKLDGTLLGVQSSGKEIASTMKSNFEIAVFERAWQGFSRVDKSLGMCSQSEVEEFLQRFDTVYLERMQAEQCRQFLHAHKWHVAHHTVQHALRTMKATLDPQHQATITRTLGLISDKLKPQERLIQLMKKLKSIENFPALDWYAIRKTLKGVQPPVNVSPQFLQYLVGATWAYVEPQQQVILQQQLSSLAEEYHELMYLAYLLLTRPVVQKMRLDIYQLLQVLWAANFPIAGETLNLVMLAARVRLKHEQLVSFKQAWDRVPQWENLIDRILLLLAREKHLQTSTWSQLWVYLIQAGEQLSPCLVKQALKIIRTRPDAALLHYLQPRLQQVPWHDGASWLTDFLHDARRPCAMSAEQLFNGLSALGVEGEFTVLKEALATPVTRSNDDDTVHGELYSLDGWGNTLGLINDFDPDFFNQLDSSAL